MDPETTKPTEANPETPAKKTEVQVVNFQPESVTPDESADVKKQSAPVLPDMLKKTTVDPAELKPIDEAKIDEYFGESNKVDKNKVFLILFVIICLATAGFYIWQNTVGRAKIIPNQPKATNEIYASSIADLGLVCTGKKISNAKAYSTGTNKISFFEENAFIENSYSVANYQVNDSSWIAGSESYQDSALVGCFSHVSETVTKKSCTLTDVNNKPITLKLYDTVYQMDLYETKTGNKLNSTQINGKATDCPTFASYDKEDPKLFGEPSKSELSESLKSYVQK